MIRRRRAPTQPVALRVKVEEGTPEAYLWAPFVEHMKAGLASIGPFIVLLVVANAAEAPGDLGVFERIFTGLNLTALFFVTGGFILGPLAALVYCVGWGGMSTGLLRLMRTRDDFLPHLLSHAFGGAVSLTTLAMAMLWLTQQGQADPLPLTEVPTFAGLAIGSPLVGAAGSVIGLLVLRRRVDWYVTRERPPLPDVFRFVDRKRDRDDFERM